MRHTVWGVNGQKEQTKTKKTYQDSVFINTIMIELRLNESDSRIITVKGEGGEIFNKMKKEKEKEKNKMYVIQMFTEFFYQPLLLLQYQII